MLFSVVHHLLYLYLDDHRPMLISLIHRLKISSDRWNCFPKSQTSYMHVRSDPFFHAWIQIVMHHIREALEILSMPHNALSLASSRKRPRRTYGEVEYEVQWDDRQLCRCLYASSWRFCHVQLWIYLTSNQRIMAPPSVPKHVLAWKCQHTASRKDLLDGARLEIRLASTQDQSILRIPEGVPVNLTCN